MEHTPSLSVVLSNVAVQAFNLLLFFGVFYFAFAKSITKSLESRKLLIAKLQNADQEYQSILDRAQNEASSIIKKASDHKQALLLEANMLAKAKSDELIDQAGNKAQAIVDQAQVQATSLEKDLKSNYEMMVKTTAGSYLRKIFDKEPELQTAYMDKITSGIITHSPS